MSNTNTEEWVNEAPLNERLNSWIKTTRIQTAMVTSLAIWIGYISVTNIDFRNAILLGVVGLLVHIWGFTLNEVEDYKYDKLHDDIDGHPIAQGKVHADSARVLAWLSAIMAVATLTLMGGNIPSIIVLILSFIPGYAYDKWSKTHWWSNGYLSIWAMLMVLTGALYAGTPTIYTAMIATAVGIQIFVQVIQGDLKDLNGHEATFAETCGVSLKNVTGKVLHAKGNSAKACEINKSNSTIVSYSGIFSSVIYGMKFLEASIIFMIVFMTLEIGGVINHVWLSLVFIAGIAFIVSVSTFMVYIYDRDEIKKKSSTHELLSIVLLGLGVVGLDPMGAMLIIFVPIVWYLATNTVLHSSALNPDI